MKSVTSTEPFFRVKEPSTRDINWRYLLRKYKNSKISITEEYFLRMYAELYGILLED